jgi:hypothetical protein
MVAYKIRIISYHHIWGDILHNTDTNITMDYPDSVNINSIGAPVSKTKIITGQPESVSWRIDYSVQVNPFPPIINNIVGKQCLPFTIAAYPNSPSIFDNSNTTYTWQFGKMTPDTLPNPDFPNFTGNLASWLYIYYYNVYYANNGCGNTGSHCPNIDNIKQAIETTDYSFLKNYLYYYNNIGSSLDNLADAMANEIGNQKSLPNDDRQFLDVYLTSAVHASTTYPPPYLITYSIHWQSLYSDVGSTINVDEIHLGTITDRTTLYFHVQAIRYGIPGEYSNDSPRDILPSNPTSDKPDPILFVNSCPDNHPTGMITVSNVRSNVPNAVYTYRIAPFDFPDYINLEDTSELGLSYGNFDEPFLNNSVTIQNIKPGRHKLYLSYNSPSLKNCLAAIPFTIDSLAKLDFTVHADSTTCPEKNDGKIVFNISQSAGLPTYYLFGNAINLNIIDTLSAGSKTISVTDGCVTNKNERLQTISIGAPLKIQIDTLNISPFHPTCLNTSNGGWEINSSGGSGLFDYRVFRIADYQSNGAYTDYPNNPSKWYDQRFPSGDYVINVRDQKRLLCRGAVTYKTLDPVDTLKTTLSMIQKVACFGKQMGTLNANVHGGQSNRYSYHLTNRKGYGIDTTSSNQPQTFNNLQAGEYTLAVQNANSTYNDVATATDSVKTNKIVTIDLNNHQDITCFGNGNGSIAPVLSGGSYSFDHFWYKQDPDDKKWYQMMISNNPLSLTALQAGNYRLSAWDNINHCDTVYNNTTIHEPPLLTFDTVILHDIPCLGDTGSIDMKARGGNGDSTNYKYQYSTDQQNWNPYTLKTYLQPATYYVRVVDIKNCTTNYLDPQTITKPASKFDFSDTLSNFHGYQVTCYGNNNAWIKIVPTGGNGASYSGYKCTVDTIWHSTDSLLSNLFAGNYNLTVKDDRGCSITRPVYLSEPQSEMSISPYPQKPTCYTDTTGIITIQAYGGASPYTYRIGNNNYDTTRIFTHLSSGTYTITAKDINGCTQVSDIDLASKSPQIIISGTVDNVKCNGQKGGSITPVISGAIIPFVWQWEEISDNQLEQHYLPKGTYTLDIIDGLKCEAVHKFQITEPTVLKVSTTSKPVCVDAANGFIYPKADGGTPPYQYAVSQPTGFTSSSEIPASAGTYNVFTSDSNKCIAATQTKVETRNTKPWVDFLVATSRYALDSLIVIDVSWPLPDSVKWTFPPEANILGYNPSPIIKFDNAGSYQVTMIGYFSGCDYAMTQPLNIAAYDPDIFITDKSRVGIEKVTIIPNPNAGLFKVGYKIYPKQMLNFRIVDMYGKVWYTDKLQSAMEGEVAIQIPEAPAGSYILTVISENDTKSAGFIISK